MGSAVAGAASARTRTSRTTRTSARRIDDVNARGSRNPRPDRGVIAEPALAPLVHVVALVHLDAAADDVVEPVPGLRDRRVRPAAVAAQVAVRLAERVDVAVLAQADDQRELGGVVALAELRADAAAARAGEGLDLAFARLVLRRVEVA